MAAHALTGGHQEIHHRIPRCLLRFRDQADAHPQLDGEGFQLWLDYELEALHYGIDPDISPVELVALIEGSAVLLPCEEHRNGHESDALRHLLALSTGEETLGARQRYGA